MNGMFNVHIGIPKVQYKFIAQRATFPPTTIYLHIQHIHIYADKSNGPNIPCEMHCVQCLEKRKRVSCCPNDERWGLDILPSLPFAVRISRKIPMNSTVNILLIRLIDFCSIHSKRHTLFIFFFVLILAISVTSFGIEVGAKTNFTAHNIIYVHNISVGIVVA